jgi:hypothetical protein
MSRLLFVPATQAPDAGADIAAQTALTLARVEIMATALRG